MILQMDSKSLFKIMEYYIINGLLRVFFYLNWYFGQKDPNCICHVYSCIKNIIIIYIENILFDSARVSNKHI